MKKATQSGLETCGHRHDSQLSSRSAGIVRPSDKPQLQRQGWKLEALCLAHVTPDLTVREVRVPEQQ